MYSTDTDNKQTKAADKAAFVFAQLRRSEAPARFASEIVGKRRFRKSPRKSPWRTRGRQSCTLQDMNREEFDKLVQEGFLLIPEKFRERIQNVALLVEDEPSEEVRIRERLSEYETLLGLYQGIPSTIRGDSYGIGPTIPDTITLFKLPIEEAGGNVPEEVRNVVAETIWHEFAHYFGMDEEEVRFREKRREL